MQVFFLLAGFFGCLLYSRYGLWRTAQHRLKRIALPLALAMLAIQPVLQAVSIYTAARQPGSATAFYGQPVPGGESVDAAVIRHLASGEFLGIVVHLWFLWFLLLFFAAMLPMAWMAEFVADSSAGRGFDNVVRSLFESRWRWIVLALVTWPFLWPMATAVGPDTSLDWTPPLYLVAYYFLFFLAGWTLYRHRDLLRRFAGGWKKSLALGNLLVLPVGIGLLYVAMKPLRFGIHDGRILEMPIKAVFALYTWLMIGGLLGFFLAYLSRPSAAIRWLADSAYWCYLSSLPAIVLIQYWALATTAPALLKFGIVCVAASAVVMASYQWGVRYTWIGAVLNGARVDVKPVQETSRVEAVAPMPLTVRRRAA
jgi:hypothetical protein